VAQARRGIVLAREDGRQTPWWKGVACWHAVGVSWLASPYVPRRPQETVLFGLVQEHLEDFFRHAREAYDGPLPKYVKEESRKYLECGDFSRGFVHVQCPACGQDLAVAFCDALRDTRRGTSCADCVRAAPADAWRAALRTW